MKPGVKSTEFWVTVSLSVLGALMASGLLAPDGSASQVVGAVISAGAAMGYNVSRGLAKSKS